MPILDPERVMKTLEEGTIDRIKQFFPYQGKKRSLIATNVYMGGETDVDDIASQKRAKLRGRTWSAPVYGDFKLVDNETGATVDSVKKLRLMNLPKITRRYSYIVDGTAYQADHQWRLKSGVYARMKANGELESQFNLAKGRGFRMGFDPKNRKFQLTYGTTNIPLLPTLQAMGVSDEQIRSAWGDELYTASAKKKRRGDLVKLAKVLDRSSTATTDEDAIPIIRAAFDATELRADTTEDTLGTPFTKVTGGALLASANKLLGISRGTQKVDDRDSLKYKELWSIEDHIPERLTNSRKKVLSKLANNIDRKDKINGIVTSDIFNVPVKAFFTSTSLAQQPDQTNPIDMVGGFLRTTIMGTGGIQSEQAITEEAKLIDPSQLGFIDAIHTPEGSRSGITTHLTLGADKRGHDPVIRVFDKEANAWSWRNPVELSKGNIAFADDYIIEKGKAPRPKNALVTVSPAGGGDPEKVSPDEVRYILQSPKAMFSLTANMVPFLPSTQANRAGMATRHMEQSISLVNREAPLVQNVSGSKNPRLNTWEKIVGKLFSFRSPVSGEVVAVQPGKITIKDGKGKTHDVQTYDDFPLNEKKSFMGTSPTVKKGDKVDKGDLIADTNFSREGTIALGTNLRVAYLADPMTFEDAVVISESAAEKLRSQHLHKERSYIDKSMSVGLRKFRANYPGEISNENAEKLDEDGIIRKGMEVAPGDTIITALQKSEPSKEQLLLKGIHRSLIRPYKNRSVVWEKPYKGVVTDVVRNGREIMVYVKTSEVADIGDKVSGRFGNKGVISEVRPDEEMPRDKDGNPIHIILNPSGVPGRINPAQVFETAMGKLAYHEGEPVAVDNFGSSEDRIIKVKGHYRTVKTAKGTKRVWIEPHERHMGNAELVKALLEKHGLSETEELFDPKTGKSYGQVLVGRQYILKLMHQIDKKLTARAHGYGFEYDANLAPKGGGKAGGQRFGELGTYAMLAHGAVHNIRDSLSLKSDKAQDEVWTAIQTGGMIPSPRTAFAYEKFISYLNALGINVRKDGHELTTLPLTDKQVLEMSNGEITDGGKVIRGKDLKPEKGGLFDEDVTGGPGGKEWSHIKLSEALPNPLFERAIISLLGLTGKQYDNILAGKEELGGATGATAIIAALGAINVDEELAEAEEDVKTARKNELNKANKKVKFLRMLKREKLDPKEVYTIKNVPVIPPIFRPITAMEGGDLNVDGLNMLYRDVSLLSQKLSQASGVLPEEEVQALRDDLYNALDALFGTASPSQASYSLDGQLRPPGILQILSGRSTPKQSFFHSKLLNRRQDLSMRSVIVPNMDLGLDEVGLPRKGAYKIFRPFIVRELVRMGYSPLQARAEVEKKSRIANKALDIAVSKRPVLFKRDPILHKFGIMAFKPVLHDEKSIHIHPLLCSTYNADFDGDQMAVFVPVSQDAVNEANKMLPSKNIYNPATGKVLYQPSLAGQLGVFLLTQFGKNTDKEYGSFADAMKAWRKGDIKASDVIKANGKKTTAGRISVWSMLPKEAQTEELLTDPTQVLGKKNLQKVLRSVAEGKPEEFARVADKFKEIGFNHAHRTGFSFGLDDFKSLSALRKDVLDKADSEVAKILKGKGTKEAKDAKIVAVYTKANAELETRARPILKASGSKLYAMNEAGIKPGWNQLKQLVIAPMLVENAQGRVIPVPITQSYSEGVSSSQYWVSSSGARKGLVNKVQSVQKPGALSKQIINTAIPYVVTEDDCKTDKGVALDVTDDDLIDRFTAQPVKVGTTTVPTGTKITGSLLSKMKAAKVSRVLARSPLKCRSKKGMCSKCYGAWQGGEPIQKGTNIGVIAGQSIGERGTQLSMRTFHTGGVAGAGGGTVNQIDRVAEIIKMPLILPNKATIAEANGTVGSISKSPVGGWDVSIGGKQHYVPSARTLTVKRGDKIKKGQRLSSGNIDPRELLEQTNIDTVQRYLTDELHTTYKSEGIKKRNVEVVVKSLTNLSRVEDSGDSDEFVRGDYVSTSYANSLNKGLKNPMKLVPALRGVETLPLDRSTDWMARLQYRRLKETYTRAANEGWSSHLHGGKQFISPMPGIAYGAEFGKPSGDKAAGPY